MHEQIYALVCISCETKKPLSRSRCTSNLRPSKALDIFLNPIRYFKPWHWRLIQGANGLIKHGPYFGQTHFSKASQMYDKLWPTSCIGASDIVFVADKRTPFAGWGQGGLLKPRRLYTWSLGQMFIPAANSVAFPTAHSIRVDLNHTLSLQSSKIL